MPHKIILRAQVLQVPIREIRSASQSLRPPNAKAINERVNADFNAIHVGPRTLNYECRVKIVCRVNGPTMMLLL